MAADALRCQPRHLQYSCKAGHFKDNNSLFSHFTATEAVRSSREDGHFTEDISATVSAIEAFRWHICRGPSQFTEDQIAR